MNSGFFGLVCDFADARHVGAVIMSCSVATLRTCSGWKTPINQSTLLQLLVPQPTRSGSLACFLEVS